MRIRGALLAAILFAVSTPVRAQITAEFVDFTGGRPIAVTSPPGETSRVFVTLKKGVIRLVKDGAVQGTPFLDWTANVDDGGEGGLLGLAFHPDYATNGRFYVSYTAPFQNGASVVSQFTVGADPDVADPASEQVIWGPFGAKAQTHKAGDLHFGPDGMLYFALGDGDGGGTGAFAQDLLDPRGSILRFDVDIPYPHIPADNPFVGDANALDEIWTYGFRNPFRFGVDAATGDLWIGDVGTDIAEEIVFFPGGVGGGNAGWPCKEGYDCTGAGFCDCTDTSLVDPIHVYDHSEGCAIMAGVVYRGSAIPSLYGKFLFADFCQNRVWSIRWDGMQATDLVEHTQELKAGPGGENASIVAFGTDGAGELYLVNHYPQKLWKIVPDCGATNYCTANVNSTGAEGRITAGGSFSVSDNAFTLTADQLPQNKFAYFLNSADQGFVQNPGGSQGNLCLGGAIGRHTKQTGSSGTQGTYSIPVDLTSLPRPGGTIAVMAGETWHFTCWYRDNNPGPTSNFTDGVSVLFCP